MRSRRETLSLLWSDVDFASGSDPQIRTVFPLGQTYRDEFRARLTPYDVYNFQVVSCVMTPSVSISVRDNYNLLRIEKARDNRHDADLGLVPRNPRPVANV